MKSVKTKTDRFIDEFNDKDKLLSTKSLIVTLYSILDQIPNGRIKSFISFFELERSRATQTDDKDSIDADLLEFNRCLQQGADKRLSLENRRRIMIKYLHIFLDNAI